MRFKKIPPLHILEALFEYKEGKLYWKIKTARRVKVGDCAECIHKNTGYSSVSIGSSRYQSHRVIWKLLKKEEPIGEIDHINGKRHDNRIENLRLTTKSENLLNQRLYKNNKSGAHGVYWSQQKRKWCVQVTKNGVQKYYGCFANLDEAKNVRKQIESQEKFHDNHGRK